MAKSISGSRRHKATWPCFQAICLSLGLSAETSSLQGGEELPFRGLVVGQSFPDSYGGFASVAWETALYLGFGAQISSFQMRPVGGNLLADGTAISIDSHGDHLALHFILTASLSDWGDSRLPWVPYTGTYGILPTGTGRFAKAGGSGTITGRNFRDGSYTHAFRGTLILEQKL